MTHITEQGLDCGGIAAAPVAFVFWGLVVALNWLALVLVSIEPFQRARRRLRGR